MDLSFGNFIGEAASDPVLILITVLVSIIIFLNGWSDVPSAITTSITTRSISPKMGLALAGVFNFLGVFAMLILGSNVAETIYKIVSFGSSADGAILALCSALVAIVIWGIISWCFGIPTSQNHALVAGLSGASIAINNGFSGIDGEQWKKVIYGLIIATIVGFLLGFLVSKIIELIFKNSDRDKVTPKFKIAQVIGDMSMVFMNGFQDGQKLLAILVMGMFLSKGIEGVENFVMPIWMLLMCSIVMTLGTLIGGKKIIKSVGMKMTNVEIYQGTAADIASFLCLLISTLFGIPESSNQTKTSAMMGVGAAKRLSSVNWSVAKNIVLTWIITFPSCGILSFIITKILY